MEFFLLVLLVIVLILLINLKTDTKAKLTLLENQLLDLNRKLTKYIKDPPSSAPAERGPTPEPAVEKPQAEKPIPQAHTIPPYWESGFKVVDETPAAPVADTITMTATELVPAPTVAVPPAPITEAPKRYNPVLQPKPVKPGFFERNPDLEKFIGENLVSKIGIAILVLAIAFFVKYAIDNNWIGPVGRVAVGLLCGSILIGVAHRLRKGYKAFSSVLVGGGFAVFYFTIALAHQRFHLFGDTPVIAFIIMVVITAFAVAISLLYDRQELAVIAMIGGFASPFMVSYGSGHYHALFIYLIILNTGLLIMAYHKAWRLLNLLAFLFTIVIFGGWLTTLPIDIPIPYHNGFVYATIFYLLFFAINIANNIRENKRFIASDFGILLANTSVYFAAGLYCLYAMHASQYKGLFSGCMGVFNLGVTYILFQNKKVDTNILYLLIGITLTFISLVAPLQLQGHFITLFWASEAAMLLWLYQQSKIAIMQVTSLIMQVAMLISLFMDWNSVYADSTVAVSIIFNRAFVTTVFAAVATFVIYFLSKKQDITNAEPLVHFRVHGVAGLVLLFIAGALEINFQFMHYFPGTGLEQLYLLLYSLAFLSVFLFLVYKKLPPSVNVNAQFLLCCGGIVYYFISLSNAYNIQQLILLKELSAVHFAAHWIAATFTGMMMCRGITLLKSANDTDSSGLSTWAACVVVVIFLSVELHLLVNALLYNSDNTLANLQRIYIKTILPILWGICSFTFMWLGMRHKYKPLRIVSLSLFSITLAKLFLFDISNIPIAGKIAAFFCLGVLLLVVSFMYQRLKKIIADDVEKTAV